MFNNDLLLLGSPILQVNSGSKSYGTFIEGKSDRDTRGIFIPKKELLYGFHRVQQFDDLLEEDSVWFSFHKFLNLALECNPNVVEQLFVASEDILFANEIGQELLDLRYEFLTKNAYGRFGGYAFSQLKRLDSKGNHAGHSSHADLIAKYGYDTKHAMHLIRLLEMGIEILTERECRTLRPNAKYLLAVRHGLLTLEQLYKLADELEYKLEEAMIKSTIPDFPDVDKINSWTMSVIDKVHGLNGKGYFRGVQFNVLPLEYETVDKCSVLLVANKLQRRKNKSDAAGIVVPYKDWYTGLRNFDWPFRFEKTEIDEIRRAFDFTRKANPKMIDMIFAGDKNILYKHPMADELTGKLKTVITSKMLYNKTISLAKGNIADMEKWERMKLDWGKQKETDPKAKDVYPPVPKGTKPENASMMTKFGYDTLRAVEVYHALKMSIELLSTGTIVDSRAWESELYAIKHRSYETFNDFKAEINKLLLTLDEALKESKLPNKINEKELEDWVINFINRFHETL